MSSQHACLEMGRRTNTKQPVHARPALPLGLVLHMHAAVLYTSKGKDSTSISICDQDQACQSRLVGQEPVLSPCAPFLPADVASHAPDCEGPAAGSS